MTETPAPAKVTCIKTSDISPNPHNPRRLFDEGPMKILKESIKQLGVLVPITVYQDDAEGYFILDGERRWRCSRELQLEKIPAIIVEKPSPTQNILTMFHIHNLREGWQLMPTALKLKSLMKMLKTRNEDKLNEITKLSVSQIRRCKILLTYPKKYQNLMLTPPSKRMKTDFFIELDRIRRPALRDKLKPWIKRGDSECIALILNKFMNNTIRAVTEFRRLAEVYHASQHFGRRDKFEHQFDLFLAKADRTIEDILIPGASFAKETKEVKRSALRLLGQIKHIDFNNISSDLETIALLRKLSVMLNRKLEGALLVGAVDVPTE